MRLIPKLFGIRQERNAKDLSHFDDSIEQALEARHKYSTGWRKFLHPRTYEIEGYQSPWEDQ
jgi:hypothetical protein